MPPERMMAMKKINGTNFPKGYSMNQQDNEHDDNFSTHNKHIWKAPLVYVQTQISNPESPELEPLAALTIDALLQICSFANSLTSREDVDEDHTWDNSKFIDEVLIALSFAVFTFDNPELRIITHLVEQKIAKKIEQTKAKMVDKVSLKEYRSILSLEVKKNLDVLKPISDTFYKLIECSMGGKRQPYGMILGKMDCCIDVLIQEAGSRIEKPDRAFYSAQCLDLIANYSESLFSEEHTGNFYDKYKWAYPKGKSFHDLNLFWTVCLIALFVMSQSLEKYLLTCSRNQDKKNITKTVDFLENITGTETIRKNHAKELDNPTNERLAFHLSI